MCSSDLKKLRRALSFIGRGFNKSDDRGGVDICGKRLQFFFRNFRGQAFDNNEALFTQKWCTACFIQKLCPFQVFSCEYLKVCFIVLLYKPFFPAQEFLLQCVGVFAGEEEELVLQGRVSIARCGVSCCGVVPPAARNGCSGFRIYSKTRAPRSLC